MKMERPNLKRLEKDNPIKQKQNSRDADSAPILRIDDTPTLAESLYLDQDKEEEYQSDRSQIGLGVEDTNYKVKQRVSRYKTFFRRRKELLEYSPNWRNPWLPLTVVFTVINFLILSVGLVYLYKTKKTIEVPFIYDPVDRTWFRNDIVTVFIIAVAYLIASIFIINLSNKITNHDRRLAATINAMMLFINILFNIGIIQIFLLIS